MTRIVEEITGTVDFQNTIKDLRAGVIAQLPPDLILPPAALQGLPRDVTRVPYDCGLLSENELAITELDATTIRERIAEGSLTAVQAVIAFGRRAAIAHQVVHCLTDYFLEEGIAQAKALDKHFKETGQVVGPLHGVPISIKDHISLKGHQASNGFLSGNTVAEEDSDMVATLRSLGAVFYVKTNQPQTIMHLETHSAFGRTLNPWNTDLTPGGSSGGESALVAMKGSPLGVGTDGGGSIRNPAGNTGVYGYRPTTKTLSIEKYLFYLSGNDSYGCSTGPFCNSSRDIDLFMSAVRGARPHLVDPAVIPQDWAIPDLSGRKLRIGVMRHDGVVLPQPPMLRAFDTVVEVLRASQAVEVVEFEPYRQREGYDILRRLYFEDGGANILAALKAGGEQPLALTNWLLLSPTTQLHTVWQGWDMRALRNEYCREYAARWHAAGIDVLLCPPFPGPACPHDTARYWGYTAVYNLLDYPGIVFPTGLHVDPAVDVKTDRKDFIPDEEHSDKYNHDIYDAELYKGAPLSLQLLAYRFDDCKLFAALKVIEGILQK